MTTKFKVGDRVRLKEEEIECFSLTFGGKKPFRDVFGEDLKGTAMVVGVDSDIGLVFFDSGYCSMYHRLELGSSSFELPEELFKI